jgi:hypothetical protein
MDSKSSLSTIAGVHSSHRGTQATDRVYRGGGRGRSGMCCHRLGVAMSSNTVGHMSNKAAVAFRERTESQLRPKSSMQNPNCHRQFCNLLIPWSSPRPKTWQHCPLQQARLCEYPTCMGHHRLHHLDSPCTCQHQLYHRLPQTPQRTPQSGRMHA